MVRNEHDKAENYRCRSYIYAPDGHGFSPLAQLNGRGRGGQIYYYFNDQLGTPQELVTVNGDIVWSAVYKSYGNLAVEYQSVPQPIRLPGQYFDEESGLHYNQYWYYDPYSARYFSQDPIGLAGGENAYSYVPDPLKWIDPLGLDECPGTEVKKIDISKIGDVNPNDLIPSHSISGKTSSKKVDNIADEMRKGTYKAPPIDVVEHNGKYYIIDGHHRVAAAKRVGKSVEIQIIKDLENHSSIFRTIEEVIDSANSAGRNRLIPSRKYR